MFYSISEAALLLGVHPTTIRRWDKDGKKSVCELWVTIGGLATKK
jgi:predicted site-specific integrase-resolvase